MKRGARGNDDCTSNESVWTRPSASRGCDFDGEYPGTLGFPSKCVREYSADGADLLERHSTPAGLRVQRHGNFARGILIEDYRNEAFLALLSDSPDVRPEDGEIERLGNGVVVVIGQRDFEMRGGTDEIDVGNPLEGRSVEVSRIRFLG